MNVIKIYNILSTNVAIDVEQGEKVLYAINEAINKPDNNEERVVVDFENIALLTTAFLNKAIGELFKHHKEKVLKKIKIKNISDENDLEMFKLVINNSYNQFVKNQEKSEIK